MARREHITSQQIIGEWGSLENFANAHSISPASTKLVIYVEGAKSRPVEQVLKKYGYWNLLTFEKALREKDSSFSEYIEKSGLNPVELIDTLRHKRIHTKVLIRLQKDKLQQYAEDNNVRE